MKARRKIEKADYRRLRFEKRNDVKKQEMMKEKKLCVYHLFTLKSSREEIILETLKIKAHF